MHDNKHIITADLRYAGLTADSADMQSPRFNGTIYIILTRKPKQ